MSQSATARDLVSNPEKSFKQAFEQAGIKPIRSVKSQPLTPSYNKGALADRLAMSAKEAEETFGDADPLDGKSYKNLAAYELKAIRAGKHSGVEKSEFVESQKVGGNLIDTGITEDATPLVFDAEILQLLKQNAPFAFGRLTRRGQEGHQVVFNNVSARDSPAGYGTEGDTANLQDLNKDLTLDTSKIDLAKYMDAAAVTDFSAEASAHYMNIADLAVGARMAEYAQLHEQTVLYGEPSLATNAADLDAGETGGPGDPNAFKGLANVYTEDSTSISSNVGEYIKSEIRDLLQSDFAVNPANLEVWCSWALFDELENELRGDHGRFAIDVDSLNLDWGNYELEAGGVPIVPGHNIDTHTYNDPGGTDYSVGDVNDVFIVNTATAEYRELLPMTTIPLATRGASDEVGMVEFGTLIERSGSDDGSGAMADNSAEFGRYLSGLSVV
jgi:hypothetical protein